MQTTSPATAEAIVNYQANRKDAGGFSQWTTEFRDLHLTPRATRLANLRSLNRAPSLAREGFALVEHAVHGDYSDPAFLKGAYVDSCLDLVKRMTGASATINMYFPIIRTEREADGTSVPADFLHIDQPRDSYVAQAAERARQCGYEMKRGSIYNVWKATTPPPQDKPLAIADIRDIALQDHVWGRNLSSEGRDLGPFVGIAEPAEPLTLYYAPDMRIDESYVFLAADFAAENPLGCAHTAISPPENAGKLVPRESVELRVLALFD